MENQSLTTLSCDDSPLHLLINRSKESQDGDDDDTLISDAMYAENLIFQEVLMASFINANSSLTKNDDVSTSESFSKEVIDSPSQNCSMEVGESSQFFCEICTETKDGDQVFAVEGCNHHFCNDCIAKHISVKIQKNPNIANQGKGPWVACPGLDCEGVLKIAKCTTIVPREVLTVWCDVICESMIAATQKFYCPYKDCSALLVNDDEEMMIRESECPFCHRLFCAQCQVAWHSGVDCEEFSSMSESERGREDLLVHELANLQKWQRCPQCRFFVDKKDGCLHITCRCGYEFCYTCGATWESSHHQSCQREY